MSEIAARIANYEMAFNLQASVPDVTNLKDEPDHIFEEYGQEARQPGTYAANCLMARRLAERGVRFTQVFLRSWDQHSNLPTNIRLMAEDSDRPTYALLTDLKRRGLLDDTLVIWGGEFGRTNYSQGKLSPDNYGRDHHPRCFSIWMAGGGIRGGTVYGETCPYGYNIVSDGVHVRDFHATILHLLGIDHERLSYRFQGLDARLTGVEPARVVQEILA